MSEPSFPAFEIRPVSEAEHAVLGDLIVNAYVRDGFLHGPDDPYAPYLRDVGSRTGDAEVLVAADGERLLGSATLVPPGSPLVDLAGAGEAEIRAFAVDPAGRRRGVGTALATVCVERARQLEAKRVVLCSQRQMEAAHRIYERLGFERVPALDWRPIPEVLLWGYALDL